MLDKMFDMPVPCSCCGEIIELNDCCIGCVKGKMGYWNKIRIDFPEIFDKTAKLERKYGHSICKVDRERGEEPELVYLDELDPKRGDFGKEPNMVCDMLCTLELK